MVVAVVVALLAFWIAVGVVLALMLGRAARIADDRRHDAMLRTAFVEAPRTPARV